MHIYYVCVCERERKREIEEIREYACASVSVSVSRAPLINERFHCIPRFTVQMCPSMAVASGSFMAVFHKNSFPSPPQ